MLYLCILVIHVMVKLAFAKPRTEQNNIKTTLRPVVILGQALGIFPNMQSKGIVRKCLLVLYSLIPGLGASCLVLYNIFLKGEHDKNTNLRAHSLQYAQVTFVYASVSCSSILYLRLSINWPSLAEKWSRIDADLFCDDLYGYPWYLHRLCAAIILYSCALPAGQFVVVHYMYYSKLKHVAGNNGSVSFTDISHIMFPHLQGLFAVLWYPAAICLHLSLLLHSTLVNGFIEGFLMAVSVNLASRLRQLTNFARFGNTCVSSNRRELFWTNIRKDYRRLSNLIYCVDDQINLIMFWSYIRILTFLLNLLTSFLDDLKAPVDKLYCFYTGFHHFSKLIVLTMFSAWINEESTTIMRAVNSVPSEDYSSEVRRFYLQIGLDEVALTGNRMFKLKKDLILKVINAVVTYELIVIQYKTF